jgi:hypothetical protein
VIGGAYSSLAFGTLALVKGAREATRTLQVRGFGCPTDGSSRHCLTIVNIAVHVLFLTAAAVTTKRRDDRPAGC